MSTPFDYSPKFVFTAAVTDILTCAGHGLQVGDVLQVYTDTTLPSPLNTNTNYYVLASGLAVGNANYYNQFKLSATLNGTVIDITATGSGIHSFAAPATRPLVVVENIPTTLIRSIRKEFAPSSYRPPVAAAHLEAGFIADGITGTLEGRESWG